MNITLYKYDFKILDGKSCFYDILFDLNINNNTIKNSNNIINEYDINDIDDIESIEINTITEKIIIND